MPLQLVPTLPRLPYAAPLSFIPISSPVMPRLPPAAAPTRLTSWVRRQDEGLLLHPDQILRLATGSRPCCVCRPSSAPNGLAAPHAEPAVHLPAVHSEPARMAATSSRRLVQFRPDGSASEGVLRRDCRVRSGRRSGGRRGVTKTGSWNTLPDSRGRNRGMQPDVTCQMFGAA